MSGGKGSMALVRREGGERATAAAGKPTVSI